MIRVQTGVAWVEVEHPQLAALIAKLAAEAAGLQGVELLKLEVHFREGTILDVCPTLKLPRVRY